MSVPVMPKHDLSTIQRKMAAVKGKSYVKALKNGVSSCPLLRICKKFNLNEKVDE